MKGIKCFKSACQLFEGVFVTDVFAVRACLLLPSCVCSGVKRGLGLLTRPDLVLYSLPRSTALSVMEWVLVLRSIGVIGDVESVTPHCLRCLTWEQ